MITKRRTNRYASCVASAALAALIFLWAAQEPKAQEAKTNSPALAVPPAEKAKPDSSAARSPGRSKSGSGDTAAKQQKPSPRQITGAELYSMHCARCHPERYPNERTSAQWKTIGLHMRVRANLPAEHFRKLLKYLQENSGY
jgi:hypothetical protein